MSLECDSVSLELEAELRGHDSPVWSVVWRPQTSQLGSCGGKRILIWSKNNKAEWKLKSVVLNDTEEPDDAEYKKALASIDLISSPLHSKVQQVTVEQVPVTNSGVHERTIRNLGWTSDGRVLAAASFDAAASIWTEDSSGSWICRSQLLGHENEVKAASWSPSHQQLATCSRDKTVWIHSLTKDSKMEGDQQVEFLCSGVLTGHEQDVKNVVWHPSEDFVISASYDNSIRLWAPWTPESIPSSVKDSDNDSDWQCVGTLEGHQSTVWTVSFSPNGREFASGSGDTTVRIWSSSPPPLSQSDQSQPKSSPPLKSHLHPWMYLHPAFRNVMATKQVDVGSNNNNNASSNEITPTEDSSPLRSWYCSSVITGYHTRAIYCVAWHPHLDIIATACGDDAIRLFRRTYPTPDEPQWIMACSIANAHSADVNSVSWKSTPEEDGSWILASGGDDGVVRIFTLKQKD